MRNPIIYLVGLFVLIGGLVSGAAGDISPERARQLNHLVRQDCGSCHGMTLKGGLGTPLNAERFADADIEGLSLIILDGVPGTAMPPWRALLTVDEARWIATALKAGDIK